MSFSVFKLEEYLGQYEFTTQYLLSSSDAETIEMSELLALASIEDQHRWQQLRLGYTEVYGLPLLRHTIASSLYPTLSQQHILCFAGAEDGIFCALTALIEPGDHVITCTPCYQSLTEIPKSCGADVSELMLKESNQWRIDLNELQQLINPATKCIIINFPHNPTGQVIEQEQLQQLITVCERQGIWLFSDEVYRLLGAPKNDWASPAACLYDKALSLGVMSKSFGLAGLRVGWIACQHTAMLEKIARIKHYTSICNSAPSELLALIALNNKMVLLERNNKIVADNLNLLDDFFIKQRDLFSWVRPQGGCVAFVNYHSDESIDHFCEQLVHEQQVLLMPASVYNFNSNHFRIGFGRKNMPEALNALQLFLRCR